MKLEIERTYPLPVPANVAWTLLGQIEEVAACLPGAKITERIDDTHYKGTVAVKLGPATVNFRGEVEFAQYDTATRKLRLIGKGSDTGGGSAASMELNGEVRETGPTTCELAGVSEVMVTGKVATFGARLMNTVADVLLKQFFANLQAKAEAAYAAQPPPPVPAAEQKLNALAFIWSVFKSLLAGLFSRTKPKPS